MKTEVKKSFLDLIIICGIFIIPLIWSKLLNANYYSAKFFLVFLVSSISILASSRFLTWPALPKVLLWTLGILVLLHLTSPLLSGQWAHVYYLSKFVSFALLAYYFYTLKIDLVSFFKKYDIFVFVSAALILVFALNDFYIVRVQNLNVESGLLLGSFGNVNMMSEFLILTLPFLHLWLRTQTGIPPFLKAILLFGWFFFILYCRSRSAWIGLSLWTIYCLYKKNLSLKEAGLLLGSFAVYHLSFLAPTMINAGGVAKGESLSQRLHLYQSTLQLISEHPFGVGVGQFFNEIIPYLVNSDFRPLEYVYFDQPHSEILKWATQFGWIGFVLPAIVFFYLVRLIVKEKQFFLACSFLVLIPQVSFQFPFENPASLMYLAFLFASCLSLYPVAKRITVSFKNRLIVGILALLGVCHAFAFVTSIFWESSHQNQIEIVSASCDIYPININACFNKVHFLLGNNRLVETRQAFAENFKKFPFHAGLMRLLPSYLKASTEDRKTCEAVLEYDYVFTKQTYFQPELVKSCSIFKLPVVHQSPPQFEKEYLSWQQNLLN